MKKLSDNKLLYFTLVTIITFTTSKALFASPPTTKYMPGETLDPMCAPGDPNCSVDTAESDPTVKIFAKTTLPTCGLGQVLKWNGTSLACVTDNVGTSGITTETDPVFSLSQAYNITSTLISNWNTAFGWGNHRAAGYLTGETDPSVKTFAKSTLPTCSAGQVLKGDGTNLSCVAPSTAAESDPVFSLSQAFNITSTMLSNWNTAFGWGNHRTMGYLTGETDPSVKTFAKATLPTCTAGQVLKWNGTSLSCVTDATWSGWDNLGNHTATQNIKLNGNWLSNDWTSQGLFINSSANIGFGTSSPISPLTIKTTDGANYGGFSMLGTGWNNRLMMGAASDGSAYLATLNNVDLKFASQNAATLGTPAMTIKSSGNVGIGTASPGALLQVGAGTTTGIGNIQARDATASYMSAINDANGVKAFMGSDSSAVGIFGTLSNHGMVLRTNNTERVRIDTSGNVGIGTTTPGSRFQVVGNSDTVVTNLVGGMTYLQPSSSTPTQGLMVDTTSLASGSNALFLSAPSGWTGNFISANLNGTQKFRIDQNWLYTQSSDRRLKTDIIPIPDALDKLNSISGVTYHWIDPTQGTAEQVGVIAQDVETVFPQLVTEDRGYKGVNYAGLVAPLIEAVKELRLRNEALAHELHAYEIAHP